MDGSATAGGSKRAGLAVITAGLAGVIWFYLESAPPRLGFDDTDSPLVSLRYLQIHHVIYAQAGLALFILAIALIVATHAVGDVLASRADPLALRVVATFGLFSAAFFFMHGVLRLGVLPILYMQSLREEWGQMAYLVGQFTGIHGFAQAGITTLCVWAVGTSLIGVRTRALPIGLCVLGLVPGFRLLGILGPFGVTPDGLWIFFMASIVGAMLWCMALGVVLVARRPTPSEA